jgi:hypothetical protein
MDTSRFGGIFFHWLPLSVALVCVAGLVCVTVQQNYRQSLNDPQIQLAEDGAYALSHGAVPADIVPRGTLINADVSLAPFIVVFDDKNMTLESSASIGALPPQPPSGVLEYARQHGENRVTWQPSPQTRIALVVVAVSDASGRLVAAGRNMREVEHRESLLNSHVLLVLVFALITTFIANMLSDMRRCTTFSNHPKN